MKVELKTRVPRGRGRFGVAGPAAALLVALLAAACALPSLDKDEFYEADTAGFAEQEAPAPSAAPKMRLAAEATADAAGAATTPPPPQSAVRTRIYSAALEIEVVRVEEARDAVTARAVEIGGRVESIHPGGVVVLVPAEMFFSSLDEFEGLGRLLDRSIQAWDVGERIADLETRLRLAREARDRLYLLLQQAEETAERVKILREIRRLTEEIDGYEIQLETIADRVRYSRISISLISRLGSTQASRAGIPFPWMRALDPFSVTLGELSGRLAVDPGDSFAVFRDPPEGEAFYAESADGAVLRIGSAVNEPDGDGEFWRQGMLTYLRPLYAAIESLDLAGEPALHGVACTIPGNPGYLYEVFAVPRRGTLYVAEGLFPDGSDPSLRDDFHRTIEEAFR